MKRHASIRHILSVSATALAVCLAGGAYAQVALEEIVVTAQKRSENIQDVPIAITAFTAQGLFERGVVDVAQLGNLAPNVQIDAGTPFSGSSAVLAAYIRGVGQNDFDFNLDPGVGVYVDGVYLARSVGANTDLLDVSRVEVLKGPQGTLFGRNTIGGAISIVTRTPGDELTSSIDVTTGRYNRFDVRGSADIPLADNLLSSVSFSSKNRDGFQRRIPFLGAGNFATDPVMAFHAVDFDSASREGGQGEWNLRGKALWLATDSVKVTLAGDYARVDQSALDNSLIDVLSDDPGGLGGLYNFCIGSTADVLAGAGLTAVCGPRGQVGTALTGANGNGVNVDDDPNNDRLPFDDRFVTGDPDTSFATGNSFSRMTSYGLAGTIDWELNDNMAVKSITAYRDLAWRAGMDFDGTPLQIIDTSFIMNQYQISQELQLAGTSFSDRLHYAFGAYYFKEEGNVRNLVTFPAGLLQVDGPSDIATKTWALFTHLNYALTDKIGITLGGRFTRENKSFEGFQSDQNGLSYKFTGCVDANNNPDPNALFFGGPATCQAALGFPDPNDPLRLFPPGVNKQNFNDFAPRIGLEYSATDEVMLYASYAQGFKSGGWTTRLTAPLPEAPTFGKENAETFEGGVKSQWLDNRLQVNVAGFFSNYDGIQLNFQEGVSPIIRNAGNAEIYGFELEGQALLGGGLSLNANVGYLHAEYTFIDPNALGVTLDTKLPKTPKWNFNLNPRYEIGLGNGGALVFNLDYTHSSSLFTDADNTPLLKRSSIDLVNANLSYREPDGRWEVAVGGTNITDERYLTTGTEVDGILTVGTFNSPPEWWARLKISY